MKILNEIFRQKKLMNLIRENKEVSSLIFGDDIIDFIDKNNFIQLPQLSGKNLKIKNLITTLKNREPNNDIQNVVFSIGKNDKFENEELIDILSYRLKQSFPNAKFNVIKPIMGDQDIANLNDNNPIKNSKIDTFYDEFKNNNISVIGNYNVLDGGSNEKDQKINILKNEILQKIFNDESDLQTKETQKIKTNVDIQGEDETDFDTIYEFIDRFEKMVKSENVYNKNMKSGFKPDIEQIQIALNFIDKKNTNLKVTGNFDMDTQSSVENFQRDNNLPINGIADKKTLEEILFDLKAKSFNEVDLSKYIKSLSGDDVVKIGSDDLTTKDSKLSKIVTTSIGGGALGTVITNPGVSLRKYPSNLLDQFKKVPGVDFNKFKSDVESIGIPVEIAVRQLYTESAFSPDVISCKKKSSSGAMGIAQFMPFTWPAYGKGGDPCKVSDALPAYVRLMSQLVKKFNGRLDLAMAGYNGGPNRSSLMDALKNNKPFIELRGKIPEESYKYSSAILQP